MPEVVGEIFPANFSYSHFILDYGAGSFAAEDNTIYKITFPRKENRCLLR
jgi:hypothetical protein